MNSSLRLFPFPTCSCSIPQLTNPKTPSVFFISNTTHHLHLKRAKRQQQLASCSSYEVGGGYPEEELERQDRRRPTKEVKPRMDTSEYEALLKGGDQVTSVLEQIIVLVRSLNRIIGEQLQILQQSRLDIQRRVFKAWLGAHLSPTLPCSKHMACTLRCARHGRHFYGNKLEDMNTDETSEEIALQLAAQGVIGKRVDEMESGFMMALDYMIQTAERDQDDKRKAILEVVKETVLSHLTKKCPPHVQVVGLLCRTPLKESRHELLRRVAAGGGAFKSKDGTKVHIPGANLNDIANQADDLVETMETRPVVPDRKLLARLVIIREESRNMMGGGILDERNDRGLSTLPESEVNFLTKLVALKPGNVVQEMIRNVMLGKDEGADKSDDDEEHTSGGQRISRGIAGRESMSGRKPLPVRPGMFLETVSKVLGGIYAGNESGVTAQHLEWVHQKTLHILEEIAF